MDLRRRCLIVLSTLLILVVDPPGARLLPIAPSTRPAPISGENPGLDDWLGTGCAHACRHGPHRMNGTPTTPHASPPRPQQRLHPCKVFRIRALFPLAILLLPATAHAADFCVSNVAQLHAALATAASNGEDDHIKINRGIYRLDKPLEYVAAENQDLTISGGWTLCFGFNGNPALTVIDGGAELPLARIGGAAGTHGDIAIRRLTWQNGRNAYRASPLHLGSYLGWGGLLTVENNRFLHNHSDDEDVAEVIAIASTEGRLLVRNNLFAGNTNVLAGSPIMLIVHDDAVAYPGVFTNNTVYGTAAQSRDAVTLREGGSWYAANNLIWDASGLATLRLSGSGGATTTLAHNDIGALWGTPGVVFGNRTIDPRFVDAASGDFRLRDDSPLIDEGLDELPDGLGSYDAGGRARRVGGAVDIGAHERQERIFFDDFD
jgi:hypothetical protein